MVRISIFTIASLLSIAVVQQRDPMKPDPDQPREIEALDTVFVEEMTWLEVRDTMQKGTDTVIIATGGVEQNGPYTATGKHNYVLRGTTEAIARKLGNAMVAPIVAFVPEGNFNPPDQHMKYPGTVSLTEETFRALLIDICTSFKVHGFKHIVLIGDSGGNQEGMKSVAGVLNQAWSDDAANISRIDYVPEYFNFPEVAAFLAENGIKETPEGWHDDFGMTATIMAVDQDAVRTRQRIKADKFRINGVELAPVHKTVAWGKKIIDFRSDKAVAAIKKARKGAGID